MREVNSPNTSSKGPEKLLNSKFLRNFFVIIWRVHKIKLNKVKKWGLTGSAGKKLGGEKMRAD